MGARHLPFMWKFRLLRLLQASGWRENRRMLDAWAQAEGGTAAYNPLNTTEPWPGATDYNSVHVKNYPSGDAGLRATAATLLNGRYRGIVDALRRGDQTATDIVRSNAAEFSTWGTGARAILNVLLGK